ncbi:MAG: potassium transporter TrkG [Rhodobacterales bacterium]|nr:potassium transporter TrkG [Rhodobacterales bacterium]
MLKTFLELPLLLILTGISLLAMVPIALVALVQGDHATARAFFYVALLGLTLILLIAISISARPRNQRGGLNNLVALFGAFTVLPLIQAVPFHQAVQTTSFINAYFEMVSSMTTTGASLFNETGRLSGVLHLWRATVGWMGGLLIWVAAAAILAPLNLGGFEVTATAEPGQNDARLNQFEGADAGQRMWRTATTLAPIYVGLTLALWLMLLVGGALPIEALTHAMSTLATSGISAVGGVQYASSGIGGEIVIALFLLFALSRLTFSSDTITTARPKLYQDPEFRIGMALVIGLPILLFLRHWWASFDVDASIDFIGALRALWGGMFTVLSFLSTTGFESADWATARDWSGLGTPGLILLGLSIMGGGVATTAGGVKLLRVYALYLNGLREMERLVHPSSVSGSGAHNRRIRRKGAYVAWIFFMLFAISLALVSVILAALGTSFENSIVLSVAALTTTGPLVSAASGSAIELGDLSNAAKMVFAAAMVVGRLEALAIITLFNPALWRD